MTASDPALSVPPPEDLLLSRSSRQLLACIDTLQNAPLSTLAQPPGMLSVTKLLSFWPEPTSSSLFCLMDAIKSALLFHEAPGLSGACPPTPPAPFWNIGNDDEGFCPFDEGVFNPPVKAGAGDGARGGGALDSAGAGCGCALAAVGCPCAESGFGMCSLVGFVPEEGGRVRGCQALRERVVLSGGVCCVLEGIMGGRKRNEMERG